MLTLSALHSSGARVWFRCDECGATGDVDLARLIDAKGPAFDLTDRHPPCRQCSYWVRFYANDGQRTWGLRTREGDMAESRRRTGWLRTHGPAPDPNAACPDAPRNRRG